MPGALDFADRLLAELCGGTVAPGIVDVGGVPAAPAPLRFRPGKANALLGYEVPAREQAAILRRLECEVDEGDGGRRRRGHRVAVTPPTYRPDLIREVDLIEEVGRIAGYGMAPETLPRHTTAGGLTQPQKVRRAVRRALAACGLDEVDHLLVHRPRRRRAARAARGRRPPRSVRLSNPMSVEQSVLRTMLLPGLLKAVRDNLDRLNDPPNLFEIGKVYLWDEPVPAPAHAAEPGAVLPHEPEVVGIVLSGPLEAENWTGAGRPTDFYTLKGCVDALLASVGLQGEYGPLGEQAGRFPYLHPGKTALVSVKGVGGTGVLGQLRPDVAAAYGLDDVAVYVASVNGRFAEAALQTDGVRGPGHVPAGLAGPRRHRRPRRAGGGRRGAGPPRRRQARPQRARLRRVRGRPGAGGQALAGAARRHARAGPHAEREGHRRRARQDPQGAGAGVPGRAAMRLLPDRQPPG